jgi:LysM repeat protein
MTATKLFFILLLFPLLLKAQKLPLMIQGKAPRYYLDHEVGPKENYYSIGRLYNCSPSVDIAPFNKLDMKDGLRIGQQIMVPLLEGNYSRDGKSEAGEVLIPVYYQVGKGESIGMISARYEVSQAQLQSWNSLGSEQLSVGKKLTIGYLKVKKDLSALASSAVKVPVVGTTDNETKKKSDIKTALPSEIKKPETVKSEPVEKEIQKDSDKDVPSKLSGGYFKIQYEKQMKGKNAETMDGTAGIFKSSSGWDDGKYYCLFNSTQSGNIIRITNASNQRVIYAKVLDAIPDMKQNEGIILRLSNAAAAELGVSEGKFQCDIRY